MEKTLITGGGGYKDVTLTKKLLDLGYKTTVFDNFMYGAERLLHLLPYSNLNVINGDIRNGVPNLSN